MTAAPSLASAPARGINPLMALEADPIGQVPASLADRQFRCGQGISARGSAKSPRLLGSQPCNGAPNSNVRRDGRYLRIGRRHPPQSPAPSHAAIAIPCRDDDRGSVRKRVCAPHRSKPAAKQMKKAASTRRRTCRNATNDMLRNGSTETLFRYGRAPVQSLDWPHLSMRS